QARILLQRRQRAGVEVRAAVHVHAGLVHQRRHAGRKHGQRDGGERAGENQAGKDQGGNAPAGGGRADRAGRERGGHGGPRARLGRVEQRHGAAAQATGTGRAHSVSPGVAASSSAANASCSDSARSSVAASSRPSTLQTRARVSARVSSSPTATLTRLATRTLPSSGSTSSWPDSHLCSARNSRCAVAATVSRSGPLHISTFTSSSDSYNQCLYSTMPSIATASQPR